jgi:PAS domain S-box-containing protein
MKRYMESKKIKILAIDDNKDNLISLKALIKDEFRDAITFTALSGTKGIELAAKENPDVILLDIVMPDMDGYEVCQKLKANDLLSDIPVVFVTAIKGDKESRIRALECGAEGFLAKPIDQSELVAQIRAMVKIKEANIFKHKEKEQLAELVEERTHELNKTQKETLRLLDEVKKENEERILVEKALISSESMLQATQMIGRIGSFEMDITTREVKWSDQLFNLFGLKKTKKSIDNEKVMALIHPDDREHALKVSSDAAIYGNPYELEQRVIHPDGKIIILLIKGDGIRNKKNELIKIGGIVQDITERKSSDEKLLKSEELYRSVVQNSSDLVSLTNEKGIVTYLSPQCEEVIGYLPSKIMGLTMPDFIHPDDKIRCQHEWEQVFQHGKEMRDLEYRIIDAQNRERWISHSARMVKTNEKVLGMQNTIRNITERKMAEQKLRKSEEKYRILFNNSEVGMFRTRLDGSEILECNKKYLEILDSTYEDVKGKPSLNLWANRQEREKMKQIIITEGHLTNFEFDALNKHGNVKNCIMSLRLYPDTGILEGSIMDITERKKTEKALKNSEEESRSIMENSADAIFITNQQGNFVYTNKAVSVMLGYTSKEMKNKTIADISPPNKKEEYLKFFKQILNKGKSFTEIVLIKKDGNYILTDLNAVILPDGTVYGSCRDITERKQAESELIEAKEKAEESDRLKSAFLANMSHEIRTPMNGILGFTELLKEPSLSFEEQKDFIQTIEKSGSRMLNTINNIVDVSKIESGLVKIDEKETNLSEKMTFTFKFFKPEVEKKGLKFLLDNKLSEVDAIIKTDNEKVYGILTNLIKNAIKFTHEGSIEFGCEKKGDYLEFYVKDTGTGIGNEQKKFIFERFRQGSDDLTRSYEGSGLGLSIAKSYVEMLGGRIWVESEEGKETTFYFTIPYISESVVETEIKSTSSSDLKEVPLKNLKILIVEDDEVSYSLLSRFVQKISKDVLHAVTGIEAIAACKNDPDLDLVLMDIRMPQMNGLEATQQIRQFNKDLIIIAQTAYGFESDCKKAMEAGCNDFITKPINSGLLFELIKKHFNR